MRRDNLSGVEAKMMEGQVSEVDLDGEGPEDKGEDGMQVTRCSNVTQSDQRYYREVLVLIVHCCTSP